MDVDLFVILSPSLPHITPNFLAHLLSLNFNNTFGVICGKEGDNITNKDVDLTCLALTY